MASLGNFWMTLSGNVVVLLFLMPMAGAVLVRLLSRAGADAVHFTALTNVWISAGLAIVLLAGFDANAVKLPRIVAQQTTSLDWLVSSKPVPAQRPPDAAAQPTNSAVDDSGTDDTDEDDFTAQTNTAIDTAIGIESVEQTATQSTGPDVRLAVGVTSLSLWPILLVVATTLGCVHSIPQSDARLESRLSWLLASEAALIGTYAARDTVLLGVCLLVAPLCLFRLMVDSGSDAIREAARRNLRVQLVSGMSLLIGLLGLTMCCGWMRATPDGTVPPLSFSLDRIVLSIPLYSMSTDAAHGLWLAVTPWLFLALFTGLVLRLPMPPLHHWWLRSCANDRTWITALLSVGTLPLSYYLCGQIVAPLFDDLLADVGPRLMLWSLISVVALSLLSLLPNSTSATQAAVAPDDSPAACDPSRLRFPFACAGLLSAVLAFGACLAGDDSAASGGLLLSVSVPAAVALWLLLQPYASRSDTAGRSSRGIIVRLSLLLSIAGLSLLPPGGGFWGLLLILQSLFRTSHTWTLWIVGAAALLSLNAVRCASASSEAPATRSFEQADAARHAPALIALVPLILLTLWPAIAPQHVIGPHDDEAASVAP